MGEAARNITLDSPQMTADLARKIAPYLKAGDVMLLSGDIGSGKTHFARSLIHARQEKAGFTEDIPSPTFTLVQTYQVDDLEIWHADLYRLTSAEEIIELGLTEAYSTGICLIEWPDRMGQDLPDRYLSLEFCQGANADTRIVALHAVGANWGWLSDV